jgi:iron-sulfur cluster insertion protein
MITVTASAVEKIEDILYSEKPGTYLRSYVHGGGCSGFRYGFILDTNLNDDDYQIDIGVFKVLIDVMSMQYMTGSILDYQDELMASQFIIENPNADGTCGCGSSFNIN